jgi:hypothetical protein
MVSEFAPRLASKPASTPRTNRTNETSLIPHNSRSRKMRTPIAHATVFLDG